MLLKKRTSSTNRELPEATRQEIAKEMEALQTAARSLGADPEQMMFAFHQEANTVISAVYSLPAPCHTGHLAC